MVAIMFQVVGRVFVGDCSGTQDGCECVSDCFDIPGVCYVITGGGEQVAQCPN